MVPNEKDFILHPGLDMSRESPRWAAARCFCRTPPPRQAHVCREPWVGGRTVTNGTQVPEPLPAPSMGSADGALPLSAGLPGVARRPLS